MALVKEVRSQKKTEYYESKYNAAIARLEAGEFEAGEEEIFFEHRYRLVMAEN